MKIDKSLTAIRAKMNASFTALELIDFIGWHPDRVQKIDDVYLALCPIHRETVFRSLQLNPRNNSYQCRYTLCPGHGPADYVDLISKSFTIAIDDAILKALNHFGEDYFRLSSEEVILLRQGKTEPLSLPKVSLD